MEVRPVMMSVSDGPELMVVKADKASLVLDGFAIPIPLPAGAAMVGVSLEYIPPGGSEIHVLRVPVANLPSIASLLRR